MRSTSPKKTPKTSSPTSAPEKLPLDEVRDLLVGPELEQLNKLQNRIENPKKLAKDLSRALPEAIFLRSKQDNQLNRALTPTVEKVLKDSVEKNPKSLADAIFPAMGPAIRKSIISIVRNMVQSLSQTIDQSFSWKGLKWRIIQMDESGNTFAWTTLKKTIVIACLTRDETHAVATDINECSTGDEFHRLPIKPFWHRPAQRIRNRWTVRLS